MKVENKMKKEKEKTFHGKKEDFREKKRKLKKKVKIIGKDFGVKNR